MATETTAAAERRSGFDAVAVVLTALAVVLFVGALSLFLQGGFLQLVERQKQVKVMTPVDETRAGLLAAQRARLDEGVRWIDQERGIVGLPIETAMARIVEQGL